ncbi:prepilin-type N-terminal cleavage/methylation domain-containing protein [Verrucomicrobium sp. BvORR034]|uniref:PulJ/GspJ family protein n=1 Tax=Verrucomicrobium sp. BvORR034 TaxID=1396418 RepID=UPI0006787CD8|nr:prepilin-type N-terminal cleavage/methylation domain-containing protein [Verrucomicrobium sp. BvORR034]
MMTHLTSLRQRKLRGFSLLELLVAMAVLSLLVLLIVQVVNGALGSTNVSRKRIDADSEARRIFDRLTFDLAGMLNRPDVDFLVRKKAGNDEIFFFAEAPARLAGADPAQPVSLVGYRVNEAEQCERLGQGLSWDAAAPKGPVFLTFKDSARVEESTIEGAYAEVLEDVDQYHVVGEGVFRMEIDFLLKNRVDNETKYSSSPFYTGGTGPFVNQGEGMKDVQAIVVTLAVLDANSRVLAGDMTAVVGKFPDTVEGATPGSSWQAVAENPDSLGLAIPVAGQVRIYQRIFPLN